MKRASAAGDQDQGAEVMSLAADTDLRLDRVAGFMHHSQLHRDCWSDLRDSVYPPGGTDFNSFVRVICFFIFD